VDTWGGKLRLPKYAIDGTGDGTGFWTVFNIANGTWKADFVK
jgi:hypothetical protein